MAKEPKKLSNPIAEAMDSAASVLRDKKANESEAILAGLGLDPAAAAKASRAAETRGAAKASSKRTRQVAEIRRQTREAGEAARKGTPKISKDAPASEMQVTRRQAARVNTTLRDQGITGVTVPTPSAASSFVKAGMSSEDYRETGPGGIPDHFQALSNLAVDLNRAVSKHEQDSTPDYKGHFERIRSIIADAHSDIMSAQGAHNQGRIAGVSGVKLNTTSTEGVGNTRFNTRIDEGYQENYPRLAGEFGARNLNTDGKQFDQEPTGAAGYMKRAGEGIKNASEYLKGITEHISTTPSVASPGEVPNTPTWGGHSEVKKVADNIVSDYAFRKPIGNPMMQGDTSIVERFQPQEGSQIERLFPGVTSRGRTQDEEARRHQYYIEKVVQAGRPVLTPKSLPGLQLPEGPLGASNNFYTPGKEPKVNIKTVRDGEVLRTRPGHWEKPAPLIAEGPVTAQGNFFAKDDKPMPASEEIAREQRTGMRTVPRLGNIPEASISSRRIGPNPLPQKYQPIQDEFGTRLTPEEKAVRRKRMAEELIPQAEARRSAAREAGLLPKSPYEQARDRFNEERMKREQEREQGLPAGKDVPATYSGRPIGPMIETTKITGKGEKQKVTKEYSFYSKGNPQERKYSSVNLGFQDVPKMRDEEGNPLPSMSPKEEANTAAQAAAYRHWQSTTGNVRPQQPSQGMMSFKEYKPVLDAHMQEVKQHVQAFRRSPAYRNPVTYLQSKGQPVPSTVEQTFRYSGARKMEEPGMSTSNVADELPPVEQDYVSPRKSSNRQ